MPRKVHTLLDRITFHDLTKFLVIATGVVSIFPMIFPTNLGIITPAVLDSGEYWNLLFFPFRLHVHPIWLLFLLLIYWDFGHALKEELGKVRYGLFIYSGLFFLTLGSFLFPGLVLARYLYYSVFLAMALLNPQGEIFIYFFPVKLWVAGLLDLVLILYGPVMFFLSTGSPMGFLGPLFGLANFLIFFGRGYIKDKSHSIKQNRRKVRFEKASPGLLHSCSVCGLTDRDDPTMDFRYCEECSGDREYCRDHLFNHEHH